MSVAGTYDKIDLENGKVYKIIPLEEVHDLSRWGWSLEGLDRMLRTGHPVSVISPHERLDKADLERYRVYFCSYAKSIKRNCIYFEVPVQVLSES